MKASEPVTLSNSPINPVPRPPSAKPVESSLATVHNNARSMPKALNQAGAGVALKGVKAAKTGEAARSRGVGCTPDGTTKAKAAAKGLAPATPATRQKQGRKAEPQKAAVAAVPFKEQTAAAGAAEAKAAMPQRDQDQQGFSRVMNSSIMVIAPHLVQFMPPKKMAPFSNYTHCSGLHLPMHVLGWYPGTQHGSILHLQVKVPAAAEELAFRAGTCSSEPGETRTSLAPVDEAPLVMGTGAEGSVNMKLVQALVGTD